MKKNVGGHFYPIPLYREVTFISLVFRVSTFCTNYNQTILFVHGKGECGDMILICDQCKRVKEKREPAHDPVFPPHNQTKRFSIFSMRLWKKIFA